VAGLNLDFVRKTGKGVSWSVSATIDKKKDRAENVLFSTRRGGSDVVPKIGSDVTCGLTPVRRRRAHQ